MDVQICLKWRHLSTNLHNIIFQAVTLTAMEHHISHPHNLNKPQYQWQHLMLPCPVFIAIHILHMCTDENCLDSKSTLQEVKMGSITYTILFYE